MTIEKAKRLFAALVAYDYTDIHDDIKWRLGEELDEDEDLWLNFCYWFEQVFGISWEEAREY